MYQVTKQVNIQLVLSIVFGIIMIIIVSLAFAGVLDKEEPFDDLNFPQLGDAIKTGIYRTFGQECKPGLHKCKSKDQYWCSKNKDCTIGEHHLQGTLFEPKTWFDRYQ